MILARRMALDFNEWLISRPAGASLLGWLSLNELKGLILAQNERWRRGLGMQVEREVPFGGRTAAKGRVMCGYLPSGPG